LAGVLAAFFAAVFPEFGAGTLVAVFAAVLVGVFFADAGDVFSKATN
jgi:branched-subunit amino acid ABC-type transport system permease component